MRLSNNKIVSKTTFWSSWIIVWLVMDAIININNINDSNNINKSNDIKKVDNVNDINNKISQLV